MPSHNSPNPVGRCYLRIIFRVDFWSEDAREHYREAKERTKLAQSYYARVRNGAREQWSYMAWDPYAKSRKGHQQYF